METPHNSDKKIRVGIFFGGKSAEHEVSLQSAKNVYEALDRNLYDPVLIGIDKTGAWHMQQAPAQLEAGGQKQLTVAEDAASMLTLMPGNGELVTAQAHPAEKVIDVALPILHGPLGEDGSIQGFLELAGIPYVGPNVLGSAVGMDKDVMKRLLRDADIPIAPFKVFRLAQRAQIVADDIFAELGTPVFVKPANMGSSVGVTRAANTNELEASVAQAFKYDTKIIVEAAIEGDEIECSVLGNENPRASVIGRIIPREGDFYSYEAKYIDENGAILEIPAKIPEDIADHARELAIKTFETLACEGMGRVDMFVTKDGKVLVNEINTIPGFTKISMYPKLWEATGLSYSQLISELVSLALARHKRNSALSASYDGLRG